MSADLNEDGRNNSHCTVIGRKGLIQLRHFAADRRRFFKQINIVPGISQIQRRLHSGNSAAYDQYRSDYRLYFFQTLFHSPDFFKSKAFLLRILLEPSFLFNIKISF